MAETVMTTEMGATEAIDLIKTIADLTGLSVEGDDRVTVLRAYEERVALDAKEPEPEPEQKQEPETEPKVIKGEDVLKRLRAKGVKI